MATALVATKVPARVPEGLISLANDQTASDLLVPVESARQTINVVLGLLWIVVGLVVGSVVYISTLDRSRDFAVYKAIGATDRALVGGHYDLVGAAK